MPEVIEKSYGERVDPNAVIDATVYFSWNELQKMVLQVAADRQPFYAGSWGGHTMFSTMTDPPSVTVIVHLWKEPKIQDTNTDASSGTTQPD